MEQPVEPLISRPEVQLYRAEWRELLEGLEQREDGSICDALITDTPYSERTHAGHDEAVHQVEGDAPAPRDMYEGKPSSRTNTAGRKPLAYSFWTPADVDGFVDAWSPVTRGWFCTLTDHVLAPAWAAALERNDRYVFAPLACVDQGSRARLLGDGPSNWTVWLIVGRPKTLEYKNWGTLPGAYVVPKGVRGARQKRTTGKATVVGGKPLWLMERLAHDYARAGELICDPCCGAGTTLLGALRQNRRAVGGDALLEHCEIAASRLASWQLPLLV